ncbi:IS3 family transposase OrfA [Brucella melitensis NI]|nr:IS3 family transposase OrfA [Brucella melitensis NI]
MKQREFTEDFKREAVRILTTSGRNISSVAEDLGIGKSTLERGGAILLRTIYFLVHMRTWTRSLPGFVKKTNFCDRNVTY